MRGLLLFILLIFSFTEIIIGNKTQQIAITKNKPTFIKNHSFLANFITRPIKKLNTLVLNFKGHFKELGLFI